MWVFRKKKKSEGNNDSEERGGVLMMSSSSQTDLLFVSPADGDDARDPLTLTLTRRLCGKIELISGQLQVSAGGGSRSPKKPAGRRCEPSHHMSSSLGSACLERLIEASVSSGGESPSKRKTRSATVVAEQAPQD
ncbi:hypothetical protein NHX12_026846 [Muraenolepis orangiensis]|uniref:Uncharacterized protein n=1 Tax=Muraenolepis orangiensis TaxID=630683 RepID=A0A9Q0IN96_9TELE|nr:hypothetical protein NHX12_026846 [Muraenolepis orangiensis]